MYNHPSTRKSQYAEQLLPRWGGWEGLYYDDAGQRMYKITLNNILSRTNALGNNVLEVEKLMLYPNGYININQDGNYTKHYYADALRIASKIGSGKSGLNLCSDAMVVNNAYPGYLGGRIAMQHEEMKEELMELVPGSEYIADITPSPYPNFCHIGSGGYEPDLFFYHPDHLGSTGMVTDINATITQGFLYAPFGEIMTEYNPGWQADRIPKYSFNAKELDEENGMYYYSARYYDPNGTFISRDPMFEKYFWLSPYAYCANNPLRYVDPTGMSTELGDYYGTDGTWLFNDGTKDNKVYVKDDEGSKFIGPAGNFSEVDITNDELNLRASLSTLKQAEAGRSNSPLDYNSWNNGAVFTNDSYSKNSDAYSTHPGKNPASGSSAAGAYQFLERFYNQSDFSPINQDKAAVKNMTTASYNAALSGDMSTFKSTTSGRWTSLNHWSSSKLQTVFQQYRANELQGKSNIAAPIGTLLRK